MQNILTELKHANEQLHRQVAELQASQKLLQIKNSELILATKTSQLNTKINDNIEKKTPNSNISVSKGDNVISKANKKSNNNPTNDNTQKIYKPPPITIKGVKQFDKLKQLLTCEESVGNEQQFKVLSNDETRILTKNESQFRSKIKILEENKVEYHRYQLKSEKPFRVVLRGINHDSDMGIITNELYDQGHEVSKITNIQIKKKSDPKNKNSEWTYIRLPLFFVDLKPRENNKDIYNIKLLCHQIIKIEPPRKKQEVPQCKNCQALGHTQNYCHRSSVCVKCSEGHRTEDCPKSKKTKAKCANCGEDHTANWKGYSAYKKAIERAHPKQVSAVLRIQQKPVTTNVSYSQMASTSKVHTKTPQPKENEESTTLNDILVALTNNGQIGNKPDKVQKYLAENKEMNHTLRIIAWNANGLVQRRQELEDLLYSENIDIALISEIHFTTWTYLKIRNYRIYTTIHPSGKARGGTAVIIKESIKHYELEKYSVNHIQATSVRVNDGNNDLTVTAVYCPPQGGADEIKFAEFFHTLGSRFIVGGDYNAKHTHWGSRLITPKGRALLKVANNINAEIITTKKANVLAH
ncbi:Pre-C2HC domain,Endonuclease/exonuclease/phosphatase,Zinc finger [Cinara cedri]|uniref:Pre-C2HC domain,Endonuclease/exonuclease/phosphatase,Zinc finger n=1 Tax=Cinara cedri TaxID=506608 RepID=A0A5E4M854_9HEMI|nr:Pre-C2HC domain,Endonuclease/exonuclease/phosphatase,Zinc finger [Cinara cedri]